MKTNPFQNKHLLRSALGLTAASMLLATGCSSGPNESQLEAQAVAGHILSPGGTFTNETRFRTSPIKFDTSDESNLCNELSESVKVDAQKILVKQDGPDGPWLGITITPGSKLGCGDDETKIAWTSMNGNNRGHFIGQYVIDPAITPTPHA